MLNISLKEFTRIRKVIAKRIKLSLEEIIKRQEEEFNRKEEENKYNKKELEKALFTVKYLEDNNLDNQFFNQAKYRASSFIHYTKNNIEYYEKTRQGTINFNNTFVNALKNFKENYTEEYNLLNSFKCNIELIVRPKNYSHNIGLFFFSDSYKKEVFEYERIFIPKEENIDRSYVYENDLIKLFSNKLVLEYFNIK